MKNQKVLIIITILIIIFIGGVYFYYSLLKEPNDTLRQEQQSAGSLTKAGELLLPNGETYQVLVGKFSPPYEIIYRSPDYPFDLSNPTDVLDALTTFAWWGNKNYPQYMDKYLSLVDAGVKKNLLQIDKESGGKYFEAREVNAPTKNDMLTNKIFFWVEVNKNTKTYRVLVGTSSDQWDTVFQGLSFTLVKNGNQWLQSFDLDAKTDNPQQDSLSFNITSLGSYEEFVNTLK